MNLSDSAASRQARMRHGHYTTIHSSDLGMANSRMCAIFFPSSVHLSYSYLAYTTPGMPGSRGSGLTGFGILPPTSVT